MRRVLVAVVCDESKAALLVHHPDYEVVFAAHSGTRRPPLDGSDRRGDGGEVSPAPLLVDYDTAASLLRLSERTVRKLVSSGQLPAVRIGTAVRIRSTDLEAYVDRLGQQVAS